MLRFVKYLFASFLGVFFALLIIFSFFTYLISSGIAKSQGAVEVAENSVLVLDLKGQIIEHKTDDITQVLNQIIDQLDNEHSLTDLIKAIDKAKTDSRIKGLIVYTNDLQAGLATSETLYLALKAFKDEGKFIYSYSDYVSERAFYLTSLADRLFLAPEGVLEFNGFVINQTYFKGLLDKYSVKAEVFKVGDFKSAVEPFTRKNFSPEDKLQTESCLNDLYGHYLTRVGKALDKPVAELRVIADKMSIRQSRDALEEGLITDIGYFTDFQDALAQTLGVEDVKDISKVNYRKYIAESSEESSSNKIAVVMAEGEIRLSKGSFEQDRMISSADLTKTLDNLYDDEDVKAVVLRINSPGGDALASDLIWNSIERLKTKKPVVASFSDVAASGGYYIGMNSNLILCQPNTITGSIGVFGLFLNLETFFNKHWGITFDEVQTSPFANIGNIADDFSEAERAVMQNMVENVYETFVSKAAKGRNKSVDELKTLAGGRVWTGNQALKAGLADKIGSLNDAIAEAAKLAELADDYEVYYPSNLEDEIASLLDIALLFRNDRLLKSFDSKTASSIRYIKNMCGVQARMPFITIE